MSQLKVTSLTIEGGAHPPIHGDVKFTGAVMSIDEQTIDFGIGRNTIVLGDTQDSSVQTSLDALNADGGGNLYLKAGTYTITSALTMYSSTKIIGEGSSSTIIDFNSTAANLTAAGTSVYTTGTLTSIASGVNVTGSGTSWLANVTPLVSQLFIGNRWHLIAAVTGDTTLILAEGYTGATVGAGTAYRIATPVRNIQLEGVTLKNSTGISFDVDDGRNITMRDVLLLDSNVGLNFTNCSEIASDQNVIVSHTSDGAQFTNCGLADMESTASISNGGNGWTLNGCNTVSFLVCASNANTGDGYNCTNCDDCLLLIEASGNGGQGVEFVSGCDNSFINSALIRNNTSDGIKLTATCDNNTIGGAVNLISNGGYGINIAAATCDNNTIIAPFYSSNSSGTLNDSGTGTRVVALQGLTGTKEYYVSDSSGGAVTRKLTFLNGVLTSET